MLKTLLERAKPQLLEALENQKLEYPNLAAYTEQKLQSTFLVTDLPYGTFMDCKSLWMQSTKTLVDSPWEFFEED